jgi:hypothetical protein
MKMRYIYFFFILLTVISCHNDEIDRGNYGESDWVDSADVPKKPKNSNSKTDYNIVKYKADLDTNVYIKGFNLEKTMNYNFSNNEIQDEFKVIIKGFKVYSANVEFTITTSNGKQIYYDNFPVNGVLSNAFDGEGEYATNTQKEEFLRKWIVTFLSNESFLTPAIMNERAFLAEHSNKVIWDAIASDEKSVGFVYSKKLSSQTEIAFDKKLNKVVTYYEY